MACGQPSERRQHLAGLVAVVVDRLLAEDDQLRLFPVGHRLQQLGHRQRLQFGVAFDQDAAVGADRQRGAQGFLALRHAARDRHHFARLAGFLQPHRLFHRDFVERIHRHLDVGDIDAGTVRFHPDLDVVVDHALDWNQYLHMTLHFISEKCILVQTPACVLNVLP